MIMHLFLVVIEVTGCEELSEDELGHIHTMLGVHLQKGQFLVRGCP